MAQTSPEEQAEKPATPEEAGAAGDSGQAATPAPQVAAPDSPAAAGEDPFAARLAAHESAQRQRWEDQVAQWRKDVAADPELGGDRMAARVARAQIALDRFDKDHFVGRLLQQSGYGNNPEILRFFNRIADALMEDGLVRGQARTASMPPLEERMYAGWSSQSR